jgi:hypothetical protein
LLVANLSHFSAANNPGSQAMVIYAGFVMLEKQSTVQALAAVQSQACKKISNAFVCPLKRKE